MGQIVLELNRERAPLTVANFLRYVTEGHFNNTVIYRVVPRFVIQGGSGADVVFAAGTTGEWDRVPNRIRQRVVQVCAEEVAKENARRGPQAGHVGDLTGGVRDHGSWGGGGHGAGV